VLKGSQTLAGQQCILGHEHDLSLTCSSKLRLEPYDPRVAIVLYPVHPGYLALLRDGARIARGL
jgi:hypothetical protein